MARLKDKLNTAMRRLNSARSPRRRQRWAERLKSLRVELRAKEQLKLKRKLKRKQLRMSVATHCSEYGRKKPNDRQLEFMQDYLHYRINKPLSRPEVLRQFIKRRGQVVKKMKRAKGEVKLRYFIELKYLKKRILQTLTSDQTLFDLDSFLKESDRVFV